MRGIDVRFGHTGVDDDDAIAGIDQRLLDQRQRMDTGAGDGDAVGRDRRGRSVQPRAVVGQHLAQFDDAEVVVVERLAGVERGLRRVADEGGRDLVAFAEPELQDVVAAQSGVGDFTDARGGQLLDGGSDHAAIIATAPPGSVRRRRGSPPASRLRSRPMSTFPRSDVVSLIGAPTDVGASTRGASMGPEALRVAEIRAMLEQHGLTVIDQGNLERTAESVAARCRRATATSTKSSRGTSSSTTRSARSSPPAACRSCWAAITAWRSVASARWRGTAASSGKRLRVLWLDAHADFNTTELTPSGNCTACRSRASVVTARGS